MKILLLIVLIVEGIAIVTFFLKETRDIRALWEHICCLRMEMRAKEESTSDEAKEAKEKDKATSPFEKFMSEFTYFTMEDIEQMENAPTLTKEDIDRLTEEAINHSGKRTDKESNKSPEHGADE